MATIERSADSIKLFILLLINVLLAYIKSIVNLLKPCSKYDISGQNVLITGAGHGLGREMALRFASKGANLVLVDINEKNNALVKQEILQQQNNNIKVFSYVVDVRKQKNVAELADAINRDLQDDIDILVNNAGVVQCLPILELSPELVERTFQVNSMSHIWTIQTFLPSMLRKGRGHIVAIASIAGVFGNSYLTDYCASKYAVVGLMESLDKELHNGNRNKNINLTTIYPGSMDTGMFQTFTTRFNWLAPVLKPGQTAQVIVDSVLEKRKHVFIPKSTLVMYKLGSIVPTEALDLVREYLNFGVKPHK